MEKPRLSRCPSILINKNVDIAKTQSTAQESIKKVLYPAKKLLRTLLSGKHFLGDDLLVVHECMLSVIA
jgi:hypothetical protein